MEIGHILQQFAPDYGICAFETIAGQLLSCRAAAKLPARPRSVIMMIFPYRFPETAPRTLSRYACVPDYHTAVGDVLQAAAAACAAAYPGFSFVPFVDNGPIPEVRAAAAAGLGVVGENGLLIHPQFGSFVFLGELVTDMLLPAAQLSPHGCPACGRCFAACPGDCLPGQGRDTCVSAISQKKGDLTVREIAFLRRGGLVWGCDRCQDVCPLNEHAKIAPHPCFSLYSPRFLPEDPDFETRAYAWRGKATPLRNYTLLQDDATEF